MMIAIDVIFVFEVVMFVVCRSWFFFGASDDVPAAIGGEEEFGCRSPGTIVVRASELGEFVEFSKRADR